MPAFFHILSLHVSFIIIKIENFALLVHCPCGPQTIFYMQTSHCCLCLLYNTVENFVLHMSNVWQLNASAQGD